jgi:hypothetical protein
MRRVHIAENPGAAEVVRGLLGSAGIPAIVEGEMLFGVRAEVGLNRASLPSVHVRDQDVEAAVELLRAHEVSVDMDTPSVPETSARRAFDWIVLVVLGLAVAAGATFWLMATLLWSGVLIGLVVILVLVFLAIRLNRAS